jgi:hypothetical protein
VSGALDGEPAVTERRRTGRNRRVVGLLVFKTLAVTVEKSGTRRLVQMGRGRMRRREPCVSSGRRRRTKEKKEGCERLEVVRYFHCGARRLFVDGSGDELAGHCWREEGAALGRAKGRL